MDNKTLIDDIYGDKCECGNKSETIHTCPFAEDIHGDSETLCNCCSECTLQCTMDV
jgi:hypothetical protein